MQLQVIALLCLSRVHLQTIQLVANTTMNQITNTNTITNRNTNSITNSHTHTYKVSRNAVQLGTI